MKHIVLIGDSIFDNASYVDFGEAVIDQLRNILPKDNKTTLMAVDGDITTDVHEQLKHLPTDTTHAFLSIGGNDALRVADVLMQPYQPSEKPWKFLQESDLISKKDTEI